MRRTATATRAADGPGSGGVAVGCVALVCAVAAGIAGAEPESGYLVIDSQPPAASVETVTGHRGVTPLSVARRDLYPNRYPQQRADLYGKVVIRKPGCADVVRRVTLDDIRDGLHVRLECSTPIPAGSAAADGARPSEVVERVSERRLRQLKVLQELLDEGIISAQQEAGIRRRILERQ